MTAAPAAEAEPAPYPHRWAMLGGVWVLYVCFGLTTSSMAPLVAPIAGELGLSHAAMGSVMGAWPLVYILSAIPCGAVLDRFGPGRALFLAALIIALSGVLRSLASDHMSLFIAVAVFGIGGPLISIGAPTVIALWFTGKERGLAMGLYITGPALGNIIGLSLTNSVAMPLAGGNWRAVLLAYAGFVLASGFVWLAISARAGGRAPATAADGGRARPAGLAVFPELLRVPVVRVVLAMGICIFFFNHALNNWLPQMLREGGMDAVSAGFWASIPTGVGILGALVIPRLAVPERRLAVLLVLILCSGGATMLIHAFAGPVLAAGLVLQGIARSTMIPVAVLVLMETKEVGPRAIGSAGGLFFSLGEIGGVLGPLAVGYVSDATGGFSAALYMLTGACALMLALLARLRHLTRGA